MSKLASQKIEKVEVIFEIEDKQFTKRKQPWLFLIFH